MNLVTAVRVVYNILSKLFVILQKLTENKFINTSVILSVMQDSMFSMSLRLGADQFSKAAFGKSAFAKMCFLLLKIRLAHINRAKSKNAFEQVSANFSKKHFARCTCQNVLESTFAFCSVGVRQSYL